MLDDDCRLRLSSTRFADVRWLQEVGSTNTEVMALASAGASEGLVVVADHQVAGRGRLDRRWVEAPGSGLLASILLRPGPGTEGFHLFTTIVALAAADACLAETGLEATLKWPNDLMLDGCKLAGVLAQTRGDAVVVGIGINVNWPPDAELPPGVTALNRHCGDVDRSRLLVSLLVSLEDRRTALDGSTGRATQAAEYSRRCTTVGQLVRVELPGEALIGTATGVTPEGHLLVEVGGSLRRVSAADVIHLRPA